MQKRSEAAKQEKAYFRTKLKHTALVMLCIFFALTTIYAVDIATYRLSQNDKDQYAMRVSQAGENTMRVDIVGKRYDVDIKHIKVFAGKLSQKAKDIVKVMGDKLR